MKKKIAICPECKETKKIKQRMRRYQELVEEIKKEKLNRDDGLELSPKIEEILERIETSEQTKRPKISILNFKKQRK